MSTKEIPEKSVAGGPSSYDELLRKSKDLPPVIHVRKVFRRKVHQEYLKDLQAMKGTIEDPATMQSPLPLKPYGSF